MKRFVVFAVALLAACNGRVEGLPPHGEVLVVVDTDLPAPALASHLRVDLYSEDGRWYESRDIARPDPRDWPASFGVFSDDDTREKRVLVRVRIYPDGIVRDYTGERFEARAAFEDRKVAASIADACANAPELPLGGHVTLRAGAKPITEVTKTARCEVPAEGGSIVAKVTIPSSGNYRFWVADATPYMTYTTLMLRTSCADATSQIACQKEPWGQNVFSPGHFPRFDAKLEPGTYWLVTANAIHEWPSDLTLEAVATDAPLPPQEPINRAPAEAPALPRLERQDSAGIDPTPREEPLPSVTIDRLLLLRVVPGVRRRAKVVLRGACVGTMARLGELPHRPDIALAETCVDREQVRVRISEEALSDDARSTPSVQGTFGRGEPCPGGSDSDPFVCVPAGSFVLGSRLLSNATSPVAYPAPERVAVMPRFWMDRYEVTVARVREAMTRGFVLTDDDVVAREAALPRESQSRSFNDWCTWSKTPREREDYAITCIDWSAARRFCQMQGGDLPTEAQWEYAAVAAGRTTKTVYVTGNDEPTCDRVVSGRGVASSICLLGENASRIPFGPAPVTAAETTDRTPLGIVGLGGGVAELLLDSAQPYDSACWRSSGTTNPRCWEESAPNRASRGGSWLSDILAAHERAFAPPGINAYGVKDTASSTPGTGFRCAYSTRPQ